MGEHKNWWWEAKSIPQYPDAARSQLLSSQMQSYMQAATQYGQVAAVNPFLAQLSGKPLTNMLPTPPPDDGQLHISIRKKKIKFNFNN